MPCMSSDGMGQGTDYESRRMAEAAIKRADEVTAVLCSLLQTMSPELIKSNPVLEKWWTEHQELDRKRAVVEAMRQEQQRQDEAYLQELNQLNAKYRK